MSNVLRSAGLLAVVASAAFILFTFGTVSPVVSSGIAAEPIHHDLSSGSRFAQAGVKQQRQVCGGCVAERANRICKDRGVGPVGPALQACRAEATAEACGYCQKQ